MNMKIYRNESVLEAAKNRLRFLFDEFDEVVVNISGGKDSTVVYHLALEIAKEKGRLPLKVLFLDQEAEWQATIDQVRYSMERPEVTPLWYQIPIRLFNATSAEEHWLQCWDPAEEPKWMRPKESYSIKENSYGTDRFTEVFKAIMKKDFGPKSCHIVGVRAEETPARTLGLTTAATYKWITWGKIIDKGRDQYNFYPIYDWGPVDVWKAIHDHNWPYNRIYDVQYSLGVPINRMRVSNVHHETSVHSLFYLQEAEPETYEKLCQRIKGIDSAGKLGATDFFVKELPFMFADWIEYREFLLDKLIDNPSWKRRFRHLFDSQEKEYGHSHLATGMRKIHVNSILANDWEGIKAKNFRATVKALKVRRQNKGMETFG